MKDLIREYLNYFEADLIKKWRKTKTLVSELKTGQKISDHEKIFFKFTKSMIIIYPGISKCWNIFRYWNIFDYIKLFAYKCSKFASQIYLNIREC